MKSIGLIELRQHTETLDSFLRQLTAISNNVSVYTNDFCFSSSGCQQHSAIEWSVKFPEQSISEFLMIHRKSIETHDRVVITTPFEEMMQIITIASPNCRFYCVIHNVNNYYFTQGIKRKLYDSMQASQYVQEIVLDSQMKQANRLDNSMRAINASFPEFRSKIFDRDIIIGVVPGRVYEGRNYEELLVGLMRAIPLLNRSCMVHFLGQLNCSKFATKLANLINKTGEKLQIRTYDEYIPQSEYNNIMKLADFLILPIQDKIKHHGVNEFRGETCISGNMIDMVRFGLPAIVPDFYPLSPDLEHIVGRYNSPITLGDKISAWVNEKEFNELKKKAPFWLNEHRYNSLKLFSEALDL